jgi:hypothetical protein
MRVSKVELVINLKAAKALGVTSHAARPRLEESLGAFEKHRELVLDQLKRRPSE